MTSVLVACVGNIFKSDDGFGVEVAAVLARRELSEEVRVVDFGIRSVHLVYGCSTATTCWCWSTPWPSSRVHRDRCT